MPPSHNRTTDALCVMASRGSRHHIESKSVSSLSLQEVTPGKAPALCWQYPFWSTMRHATSCSTCRLRKKRCVQSTPDSACRYCSFRGHQCDLLRTSRPTSAILPRRSDHGSCPELVRKASMTAVSSSSSSSSNGNSDNYDMRQTSKGDIHPNPVCSEVVELYFDLFHNKQQILFHRQAFLTQQRNQQLPDYIFLGMVALVARYLNNST